MRRSNGLALRHSSKTTVSDEYDSDTAARRHEINDVRGRGTACRNRTTAYTELKAAYWHHEHSSDPPYHVYYAVVGVSRMTLPLYVKALGYQHWQTETRLSKAYYQVVRDLRKDA